MVTTNVVKDLGTTQLKNAPYFISFISGNLDIVAKVQKVSTLDD